MDWTAIITEIGGGLPAVVIAGLAFVAYALWKRINVLTDKFIDMNADNTATMKILTSAVERRAQND